MISFKNEWVAWGKILTNFSRQFLKITQYKGDSRDISSPKCLIFDDTLLCKTGKTIEHIGNGYKNRNKYLKTIELANQYFKERDADSPGFQRIKQLSSDKISMAIQMVKNTIKTGFEPAYVLANPCLCLIPLCLKYRRLR